MNMDQLIEKMQNVSTEYDEYEELTETGDLKSTYERYNRYINGIHLWTIDECDYNYIKNMILEFIFLMNKNDQKNCLKLMKIIDKELINILN